MAIAGQSPLQEVIDTFSERNEIVVSDPARCLIQSFVINISEDSAYDESDVIEAVRVALEAYPRWRSRHAYRGSKVDATIVVHLLRDANVFKRIKRVMPSPRPD